jgi:hypothetical protein
LSSLSCQWKSDRDRLGDSDLQLRQCSRLGPARRMILVSGESTVTAALRLSPALGLRPGGLSDSDRDRSLG